MTLRKIMVPVYPRRWQNIAVDNFRNEIENGFQDQMHDETCHRDVLSSAPIGSIALCPCGTIHLTIGAVTLRLVPEAMVELAELVGRAAVELATRTARRAGRRMAQGVLS